MLPLGSLENTQSFPLFVSLDDTSAGWPTTAHTWYSERFESEKLFVVAFEVVGDANAAIRAFHQAVDDPNASAIQDADDRVDASWLVVSVSGG